MTKEVKHFNQDGYTTDVRNHNTSLEQLQAIRSVFNREKLDISGKDLETLYKAKFSIEAVFEMAQKRYKSTKDRAMREVFENHFCELVAKSIDEVNENRFWNLFEINTDPEFKFTANSVEATDWLERRNKEHTTYFTDKELALWERTQKAVKELNELYATFSQARRDFGEANGYRMTPFQLADLISERGGILLAKKPEYFPK